MTLAPVENLLRTRIGLDPASLGPTALAQAVERRMHARHLGTRAAYAGLLSADAAEWLMLVAALEVTETWFFRGGRPLFDHLADWLRGRPAPRVLVVPCSTGEEAYSLAIALADRAAADVRIDAVDLLSENVARAAAARYPVFSFREPGPDPRDRYFDQVSEQWELRPEFRGRVRFRTGNAVSPVFLSDEPAYDLILCRNLFIYLTAAARRQVVENLDRLLSPTGRLCVTASEADQLPVLRFRPDGPPGFVIYARAKPDHTPLPWHREPTRPPVRLAPLPEPVAVRPASTPPPAPDPLDAARARADAGDLDAALAACEPLRSADAFALQGVIHLAANRPDRAADVFRKALYLDPGHPEALAHMASVCDQRGDAAGAAAFRRRLARTGGAA